MQECRVMKEQTTLYAIEDNVVLDLLTLITIVKHHLAINRTTSVSYTVQILNSKGIQSG